MNAFAKEFACFFVKELGMLFENVGHFDSHRAVDEGEQVRNAVFAQQSI